MFQKLRSLSLRGLSMCCADRSSTSKRVADRMREDYQARVQARLGKVAPKPQSLEEIRREARENWLRMRQDRQAESTSSLTANKALDDDHGL